MNTQVPHPHSPEPGDFYGQDILGVKTQKTKEHDCSLDSMITDITLPERFREIIKSLQKTEIYIKNLLIQESFVHIISQGISTPNLHIFIGTLALFLIRLEKRIQKMRSINKNNSTPVEQIFIHSLGYRLYDFISRAKEENFIKNLEEFQGIIEEKLTITEAINILWVNVSGIMVETIGTSQATECQNILLEIEKEVRCINDSQSLSLNTKETYEKVWAIYFSGEDIMNKEKERLKKDTVEIDSPDEDEKSIISFKNRLTVFSAINTYIQARKSKEGAGISPEIFGNIIKGCARYMDALRIEDVPFLDYKNWIYQGGNEEIPELKAYIERMKDIYRENYKDNPETLKRLLDTFDKKIVDGANFYMLFLDKNLNRKSGFWENPENMVAYLRFTPHESDDGRKSEYAGAMNIAPEYQGCGLLMMVKEAITERISEFGTEVFYGHVRAGSPVERIWKQLGFEGTGVSKTFTYPNGQVETSNELKLTKEHFLVKNKI